MILGLVGGIACGKTTVAKEFEALGALRVDADALAHEALDRPASIRAVTRRFGTLVLGPFGKIDRKLLAQRVFSRPRDLRFLERLLHPQVAREIRTMVVNERKNSMIRAIVLDVPLLVEAGLDRLCDAVVYIDAPAATRIQRTMDRRGWGRAALKRRERYQLAPSAKRRRADYVLSNRGTLRDLKRATRRLYEAILASSH